MVISYSREAEKAIIKLTKREQRKVIRKISFLAEDPSLGKLLKGELADLRSLRAWPYRIIYRVGKSEIFILIITHRQGVYK